MEDPLAIKCLNSWKINIERQSHEDLNLSYIMKQENATKDNVIQCSGSNQQEERHVTLNIINQILNDNKISKHLVFKNENADDYEKNKQLFN